MMAGGDENDEVQIKDVLTMLWIIMIGHDMTKIGCYACDCDDNDADDVDNSAAQVAHGDGF